MRYSVKGTVLSLQLRDKTECYIFVCIYKKKKTFSPGIYRVNQIIQMNVLLTGRRVVWSPQCPLSSLQVVVVGVEEGVKAGSAFPQEEPLPLEALL